MKRIVPIFVLLALLHACLGDWGFDDEKFPCRGPEDCAEGYRCDDTRYICVQTASVASAELRLNCP